MSWPQFLQIIAIPCLTILISGISAYLGAKRGRTAAFRQALYAKQIEACSELSIAAWRVYDWLHPSPNPVSESDLDALISTYRKWSLFLPSDLNQSFFKFIDATSVYLANEKNDNRGRAFLNFHRQLVKLVGVAPLTKETLSLMKQK